MKRLAGLSSVLVLAACGAAVAADRTGSPTVCPAKPKAAGGTSSKQALVPRGASRALLCRYHFNQLQGHALIERPQTIALLRREFDTLRAMPSGTYSCPADFGIYVSARFDFPGRSAVSVLTDETGCETVTNGRLRRWAIYPPGPTLLRQLLSYTGCRGDHRASAGACS